MKPRKSRHSTAGRAPRYLDAPVTSVGWASGRFFRLGDLSADIGLRGADAKDSLSLAGVPRNVPLVTAMNSLIGRHQHALDTQRRFVSDAAHELRTPLAALQIQIDNLGAQDLPGAAHELAQDLQNGSGVGRIRSISC
jgi:two-component system OmpR family sensor kinase